MSNKNASDNLCVRDFLFLNVPSSENKQCSSESTQCSDLFPVLGHVSAGGQYPKDSIFKCTVCSVHPLGKGDLDKHCREETHANYVGRIREAKDQWKKVLSVSIATRVSGLPEKTQRLVHEQLGRHLLDSAGSFQANSIIDELLPRYEQHERVTVLELVVWKAMCLAEIPETVKGYHVFEWLKNGWNESKKSQQSSRSITIIMSLVVPFLGDK